MTEKRQPGRPRTAKPIRTKSGHSARVWVEEEGERVRKQVPLGTKSRVVATARSKRLLAGEAPELVQGRGESFAEAAERIIEASGRKGKEKILSALRRYAYPVIGELAVSAVTSEHILEVLSEVEAGVGGWTGSVRNVRNFISLVLEALVARRVLSSNEALRIKFRSKDGALGGKRIRRVRPARPVLTDGEFEKLVAFLVWEAESGGTRLRAGALELLVLILGARVFGMRTSDLHAWVWEMVDTQGFADAYVPRQKTDSALLDAPGDEGAVLEQWRDEPRTALPEPFARWLELWWRAAGCPAAGAVFGCRRGKRAGEQKKGVGYVRRLKAALWRAGVTRPLPGFERAASDEERRALCELQSGNGRRRSPVDFHSFRRASATAAGKAVVTGELTLREAMLLTHHSDPAVFARYQARSERIVVPESAMPTVVAPPAALFQSVNFTAEPKTAPSEDREVRGMSSRATPEVRDHVDSSMFSHAADDSIDADSPRATTQRQNSLPVFADLDEVLAIAVQLAMKEADFASLEALVEVAKRRRATLPDNVSTLDAARRRKS